MEKLNELYQLDSSPNYYVLVPFTRLGLQAKWRPSLARAVEIVSEQGNVEFTVPLYRDIAQWEEQRDVALQTFKENQDKYMKVVQNDVKRILKLDDQTQ